MCRTALCVKRMVCLPPAASHSVRMVWWSKTVSPGMHWDLASCDLGHVGLDGERVAEAC